MVLFLVHAVNRLLQYQHTKSCRRCVNVISCISCRHTQVKQRRRSGTPRDCASCDHVSCGTIQTQIQLYRHRRKCVRQKIKPKCIL